MPIKKLIERWEQQGVSSPVVKEYSIKLSAHDAARIAALAELYPLKNEQGLVTELLTAALGEIEAAFPYRKGSQVIAEDELGDPIYEDTGLTPKFLELVKKHTSRISQEVE